MNELDPYLKAARQITRQYPAATHAKALRPTFEEIRDANLERCLRVLSAPSHIEPKKAKKTDRILMAIMALMGGVVLGAIGVTIWMAEFI